MSHVDDAAPKSRTTITPAAFLALEAKAEAKAFQTYVDMHLDMMRWNLRFLVPDLAGDADEATLMAAFAALPEPPHPATMPTRVEAPAGLLDETPRLVEFREVATALAAERDTLARLEGDARAISRWAFWRSGTRLRLERQALSSGRRVIALEDLMEAILRQWAPVHGAWQQHLDVRVAAGLLKHFSVKAAMAEAANQALSALPDNLMIAATKRKGVYRMETDWHEILTLIAGLSQAMSGETATTDSSRAAATVGVTRAAE